jgi:hypothetical protein
MKLSTTAFVLLSGMTAAYFSLPPASAQSMPGMPMPTSILSVSRKSDWMKRGKGNRT